MSQYLQWIILTAITGSPVAAGLIVVVGWFLVDRYTLGLLPDPLRFLGRWRRAQRLERTLLANPHDRQARRELAELNLQRGRAQRAVELLKPNLEAGDDDVATVFTMGAACLAAGHEAQGVKLLDHVEELQPSFRVGEVHLAKGRAFGASAKWAEAKAALEQLVKVRTGTVEGRVRLAKALAALGDDAKAALLRDEAWNEYVSAPAFQRRQERWWAYRARPSRPLLYVAIGVLALFLFGRFAAPQLAGWAEQSKRARGQPYTDPTLQAPDPADPTGP